MSTPPLPQSIIDMLKSRSQATRWHAELHNVREFRAFCCEIDANGIMGVSKEPVIFLAVTPNPLCAGASISWDMRDSYAPGSTITSWEIDFGDGGPGDSGVSISAAQGSHSYATAGDYVLTATVEEGSDNHLTQTVKYYLTVVDCSTPGGTWTYIATDGEGVQFIDWLDASPALEARNTGLTGLALNVRHLALKPGTIHLADTNHELWAATAAGAYRSTNGGREWTQVLGDLDTKKALFDPTDPNTVYIAVEDGGIFMYKTTDNGSTWTSREVT